MSRLETYKRNNETQLSTRLTREDVAAFDVVCTQSGGTRAAVARAAIRYMLENWKDGKASQAAWMQDILAEMSPNVVDKT